MTRRTVEAYTAALKYIHENLIPLSGKGFLTDFEKAMRLALYIVLPSIIVYGCWFHFCQAVRRKMTSMKDLAALVRKDISAKNLFRRFQCLASLPSNVIEKEFVELSKEAILYSEYFWIRIDYYDNEWIKRVKPVHFSVYLKETRTTASAEAFNGKSNKTFRTHGNFYHFCETLLREELVTVARLQQLVNGSKDKQKRKAFYVKRDKLRDEYTEKLQKGTKRKMLHLYNIISIPKVMKAMKLFLNKRNKWSQSRHCQMKFL